MSDRSLIGLDVEPTSTPAGGSQLPADTIPGGDGQLAGYDLGTVEGAGDPTVDRGSAGYAAPPDRDVGEGGEAPPVIVVPDPVPIPAPQYRTVTTTYDEYISDFSAESLAGYEAAGAVAIAVYSDGTEEQVPWSQVSDPNPESSGFVEVQDAQARATLSEVQGAIGDANDRLDAQAQQLTEAKGAAQKAQGDINAFKQTASATYAVKEDFDPETGSYTRLIAASYATKAENDASTNPNLSPFFAHELDDIADWTANAAGAAYTDEGTYWLAYNKGSGWGSHQPASYAFSIEEVGDGWAHVVLDNTSTATRRKDFLVRAPLDIEADAPYTWLFEVRSNNSSGSLTNANNVYIVQASEVWAKNIWFWGSGVAKVLEGTNAGAAVGLLADFPPGTEGTYRQRVVKKSKDDAARNAASKWLDGQEPRNLVWLVFLAPASSKLDFEVRVSLYEGEYTGAYKPYVPPSRTLATKHEVVETAEEFRRTLSEEYASKDDLTGATASLATKSEVQQTANSITQSVSQTYATKDALAGMQVGTRNLLLGTSTPTPYKRSSSQADYPNPENPGAWGWYAARTASVERTDYGIKMVQGSSSGTSGLVIPLSHDNAVAPGGTYTLAFRYRTNMPNTGNPYFLKRTIPNWQFPSTIDNSLVADGEWHDFTLTFDVSWTDERVPYALLLFYRNTANEWVEVADGSMRLVEGTQSVSWGPAPEDLLTSSTAALVYSSKTDLKQTADAIRLTAEAALRRDPTNMLLDWNAPTNAAVDASAPRYWSDGGNSMITCANIAIDDPPEPGIANGARMVCDGTQTAAKMRSLAFYSAVDTTTLPLVPGQTYTASWWARCTDGAGSTRVRWRNRSTAEGATTGVVKGGAVQTLSGEWRRFRQEVVLNGVPQDYCRLWFDAYFAAGTAGTIELCGFRMEAGRVADSIDLSSYTQRSEFSVEPDKIASTVADSLRDAKGYADERKTEVEQTAKSLAFGVEARTANFPNLEPYYSQPLADFKSDGNPDGYWRFGHAKEGQSNLEDGWAHVSRANTSTTSGDYRYLNQRTSANPALRPSTSYTAVLEVRNATVVGRVQWVGMANRTGATVRSQFAAPDSWKDITGDGIYRVMGVTRDDLSDCFESTSGYIRLYPESSLDADIRMSLYESPIIDGNPVDYAGPYKPYSPSAADMYEVKASIRIAQDGITSEVNARKDAISGLAAGGRNLLLWTDEPRFAGNGVDSNTVADRQWTVNSGGNGTGSIATVSDSPVQGVSKAFRISGNTSGNRDFQQRVPDFAIQGTAGKWMLGVYVRAIGSACTALVRVWSKSQRYGKSFAVQTGAWQRVELPITLSGVDESEMPKLLLGVTGAGSIEWIAPKLEQGTVATGWTPAPDLDSTTASVSSRVVQTATDVTTLFTNSSAGVDISYMSHTSATSAPSASSASWSPTMPARQSGKYIWMKVITRSFKADKTVESKTTMTCISGTDGLQGTDGGRWYSGTGITGTSTTATVFSSSGVADAVVGDMYLNTSTWNTYRCTAGGAASAAKWAYQTNIKGQTGTNGRGVSSTATTYQAHSSGTSAPSGTWSTSVPATTAAKPYLWTRTVTTYTDSTTSTAYAVSRQGADGKAGKGVSSASTTYQLAKSGTTAPTGTWSSTVPATSDEYPFLWSRTITTYTDSTTSTAYAVSSRGADGLNGKGISSITEYYALSSSTTAPADSEFSTGAKAPTLEKRYLWNYEKVAYTDGTDKSLDKHIAAVYGQTGAAGKGIASITEYYAASSSGTSAPADSAFSTSVASTSADARFLWNYEVVMYSDGNSEKTAKRVIGTYGEKGEPGEDGTMVRAVSTNAASVYLKTATANAAPKLEDGTVIQCMFSPSGAPPGSPAATNATNGVTLNVASTGSRPLAAFGQQVTSKSLYRLKTGVFLTLVYDAAYGYKDASGESKTGACWVVADAAAMTAYNRENSAGLAVGTNYNHGYSQVDNAGGFRVMRKSAQTAAEDPSADVSLAELNNGTLRLGKKADAHLYGTSSAIAFCDGDYDDTAVAGANNVLVANSTPQVRIGRYAAPHVYADSTGVGVYPASTNSANEARVLMQEASVRVGQQGAAGRRNVLIDSAGVHIRDNATDLAQFGESVVVGRTDSGRNNVAITSDGIALRNGTTQLAQFTTDAVTINGGSLGRVVIGPNGLAVIKNGYGTVFETGTEDYGWRTPGGSSGQTTIGTIDANVGGISINHDKSSGSTRRTGKLAIIDTDGIETALTAAYGSKSAYVVARAINNWSLLNLSADSVSIYGLTADSIPSIPANRVYSSFVNATMASNVALAAGTETKITMTGSYNNGPDAALNTSLGGIIINEPGYYRVSGQVTAYGGSNLRGLEVYVRRSTGGGSWRVSLAPQSFTFASRRTGDSAYVTAVISPTILYFGKDNVLYLSAKASMENATAYWNYHYTRLVVERA